MHPTTIFLLAVIAVMGNYSIAGLAVYILYKTGDVSWMIFGGSLLLTAIGMICISYIAISRRLKK